MKAYFKRVFLCLWVAMSGSLSLNAQEPTKFWVPVLFDEEFYGAFKGRYLGSEPLMGEVAGMGGAFSGATLAIPAITLLEPGVIEAYLEEYFHKYYCHGVYVLICGDQDVIPAGRSSRITGSPDGINADSDHVYEVLGRDRFPTDPMSIHPPSRRCTRVRQAPR